MKTHYKISIPTKVTISLRTTNITSTSAINLREHLSMIEKAGENTAYVRVPLFPQQCHNSDWKWHPLPRTSRQIIIFRASQQNQIARRARIDRHRVRYESTPFCVRCTLNRGGRTESSGSLGKKSGSVWLAILNCVGR